MCVVVVVVVLAVDRVLERVPSLGVAGFGPSRRKQHRTAAPAHNNSAYEFAHAVDASRIELRSAALVSNNRTTHVRV